MHSLVLEVDPESPRTAFFAVSLFLVAATVAPTCRHLSCSFSFLTPTFAVAVGEKRLSTTWSRQTIQALPVWLLAQTLSRCSSRTMCLKLNGRGYPIHGFVHLRQVCSSQGECHQPWSPHLRYRQCSPGQQHHHQLDS